MRRLGSPAVVSAGLATFALTALACDPTRVERPLELELVGLSGRAETLAIKLLDPESAPACGTLGPAEAWALDAPLAAIWTRSSGAERELALDGIERDRIQVVAVALDAAEAPIQVGCAVFRYPDLERPERSLELSMSGG